MGEKNTPKVLAALSVYRPWSSTSLPRGARPCSCSTVILGDLCKHSVPLKETFWGFTYKFRFHRVHAVFVVSYMELWTEG